MRPISYELRGFPEFLRSESACRKAIERGDLQPETPIIAYGDAGGRDSMLARQHLLLRDMFPQDAAPAEIFVPPPPEPLASADPDPAATPIKTVEVATSPEAQFAVTDTSVPNSKPSSIKGVKNSEVIKAKVEPGFTGGANRAVQSGLNKTVDAAEVSSVPMQEHPSGVSKSILVILILVTAIFAFIFVFERSPSPAVEVSVSGRANARDKPSAEGSNILDVYDVGTQLSGTWVDGASDANERWLKIDVDGQEHYIWDGNLSAATISLPLSTPPESNASPNLDAYLGKYPYEKVSGVSFWKNPVVVSQVEKLISSPSARRIILGGGVETPIAAAGAQGERLFGYACEPHNCNAHNWSIAIARDGTSASVCYYNADGGPVASANYDDTMEFFSVDEGCQLGD